MAHRITFSLPSLQLYKTDATIIISKNNGKLGEIKLSKGGIDYYPNKRKTAITLSWSAFDKMMKKFNGEI